ncbi:TatD family hydrolase [uncultured Eubacterium sp.]|uniref:TatD family hydrolase n=1 Tax=uncultured Eubacterium sp. TaxID=165185 RepID=UPI0025F5238C|nr:TatD family hydrolase [uncultured Eubacterium sp.]
MYTNIFDTHAHYDDEAFDDDRESLILSLKDRGVVGIVSCGCDIASTVANQNLSHSFDDFYFAAGFHPENLEDFSVEDLEKLEPFFADEKCVAVGEIGLDYHWMNSTKEKQRELFVAQIELAKAKGLPVIVHDREAHGDTLDILKATKPSGVLHCFSGSVEMAREVIKLGMFLGFNGVATFKNARKIPEVIREIPLDRIVLETDCPYLAPEPHRGKRNDSSFIPFIAQRIGEILGISAQEVLDVTNKNARALYNLT